MSSETSSWVCRVDITDEGISVIDFPDGTRVRMGSGTEAHAAAVQLVDQFNEYAEFLKEGK